MHLHKFIVVNNTKYMTESLPNELLKIILRAVFNTKKSIKMDLNKNFVRIIEIIKYHCRSKQIIRGGHAFFDTRIIRCFTLGLLPL